MKEKVYDPISGHHFYEDKVIKMKIGATLDIQWIKERIIDTEMEASLGEAEPVEETENAKQSNQTGLELEG